MPKESPKDAASAAERRLYIKADAHAAFSSVETGEDLREWTYHAKSEDEFMGRLNYAFVGMPAFPVEIHSAPDPNWEVYERFKAGFRDVAN